MLWRAQERALGDTVQEIVPARSQAGAPLLGAVHVSHDTALRQSAVWGALRVRADLISSLPCDVFRKVGKGSEAYDVEVTKPPVLISPDGEVDLADWVWMTQFDLDRAGNTFGLITAKDGFGLPSRIELVPIDEVTVRAKSGQVLWYRICGEKTDPEYVWHERQYRLAGSAVGLNVVNYAAATISGYLSAQKFALDFYRTGGKPSGTLKNTEMEIPDPKQAEVMKTRFKAATSNRDIFVTGRDWEWTADEENAAAQSYLEELKWGKADVALWFNVPGDILDAAMSGSAITYANVAARQTQLLVIHLGPAIGRRERTLGRLTPSPRTVKLNSDALLRMDPHTRAQVILARVSGRTLAPSEARAIDNLPPFTPDQIDEINALLPNKSASPAGSSPGGSSPAAASAPESQEVHA